MRDVAARLQALEEAQQRIGTAEQEATFQRACADLDAIASAKAGLARNTMLVGKELGHAHQ